jgi:ribose 5-phosphate isomerase B
MSDIAHRVIVGADDEGPAFDAVLQELKIRGADVEVLPVEAWPQVARRVGEAVAGGRADMGVLACWTGTGTSIMANKVPGVRAALCWDPWIAEGARRWNDANVLVISLQRTSPEMVKEILAAWLAIEAPDPDEAANIAEIAHYEGRA